MSIEVNIVFGYQITGSLSVTDEIDRYAADNPHMHVVSIPDNQDSTFIGHLMLEQAVPEDSYDFERLDPVAIETPETFYLPYSLARVTTNRLPKMFVFWNAPY